jgi:hypothetical protein
MPVKKHESGRPLGSKDRVISQARRDANLHNAQCPGGGNPGYDADVRELIKAARNRGARALPDVVDDVIRIATTGYTRYTEQNGEYRFVRVEPETRLYAARYLGDRCGLSPRVETEVSAAEGMPLTLIVMGEDAKSQ